MDIHSEDRLASEAASTTGAVGDDRATVDFDDINVTHRPRRHDDDEEGSDVDDDVESATSAQAVENSKVAGNAEEEKELPSHACA